MNAELPEELLLLKNSVREFVDRELVPVELDAMDGPKMKPDVRARLEAGAKARGLWLLDTPEELGGQGMSVLAQVAVWEELYRSVAVPTRGPGIFGPEVQQVLLGLKGELRERYLLPLVRGEKRTAFAQTEPDAGSDPGSMRTTAVRQGDHYVVNGYKRFISHAKDADFFQLVAATDRARGSRGGLSFFLVDADTPGISIVRSTMTMMGAETWEIAFDDVRVPVRNRVGEEGEGMGRAQSWLVVNRLRQACIGLGYAQRSIELMSRYAKQRVTFGAPLADRQAVQFMIANSYMEHRLTQSFIYQVAAMVDAGASPRKEGYMAKIAGTELGQRVTDRCLQIHGGIGLTVDLPVEKMWRDARSLTITEGPVEVMRMVLAREVLREY